MDLRAGELHKHGLRVRLQEQPFQVLVMLVENPGEVVTREELQKKLWPADTFVDFDHGLNKAMSKIREALGDSAESPRFVETVARRGYRSLVVRKNSIRLPLGSDDDQGLELKSVNDRRTATVSLKKIK
jgi:DNA-binding winged helix-turn-helix (wHTH) protein